MSIEKICAYYWGRDKIIKVFSYAEKSLKAVHERVLRKRVDRKRRLFSHDTHDIED